MEHIKYNSSALVKYIIIFTFSISILYLAKTILIPLAFAAFLAMLLYPLCRLLEKKFPKLISIIVTFLIVFFFLAVLFYLLGSQIYNLFENIKGFSKNIEGLIDKIENWIHNSFIEQLISLDYLKETNASSIIENSSILQKTILSSTTFFGYTMLTIVYTFLFLLYRTSLKNFILYHFDGKAKENAREIIFRIQQIAQKYFLGLIFIVIILGTLNGLGLLMIGIDYPFLFGYFAALLAIVPYIGTFVGGLLPFLYALINYDSLLTPLLVIGWYMFVQVIEGNILTPKIIGSQVSINPLIALIALITGGVLWGIAGMILFIPLISILKVIFDNINKLKPYGILLSSDFGQDEYPVLKKLGKKISKTVDKIEDTVK